MAAKRACKNEEDQKVQIDIYTISSASASLEKQNLRIHFQAVGRYLRTEGEYSKVRLIHHHIADHPNVMMCDIYSFL